MFKNMNTFTRLLGLVIFSAAFSIAQTAHAATVILDPTGLGIVAPPDGTTSPGGWVYRGTTCSACAPVGVTVYLANGSGTPSQADINEITGATLTQLYKYDIDSDTESGAFASSYTTTYFNSPDDPSEALIKYDSAPAINSAIKWLEVKDGNHDPIVYLFDISVWAGVMDISMLKFWPDNGAISHVAIYGSTSVVPVPAALPLFGSGLVILGFMGWRRRRKACLA